MNKKKKFSLVCNYFTIIELLILLLYLRKTMVFFVVLTVQIILLFLFNFITQFNIVSLAVKKYPDKIKNPYSRTNFHEIGSVKFSDDAEITRKRIVLFQGSKCFFRSVGMLFGLALLNIVIQWFK